MTTIRVPRYACFTCGVELEAADRHSVSDSDGRSADAIVTKFRCAKCGMTYEHWRVRRFPTDRMMWFGDREPASETELELLTPWVLVTDGSNAEAELQREVGPQHPLFRRSLRAVARRSDCDDVLFVSTERVCVVHLTWKGTQESDPHWPSTEMFESVADFVARRMRLDREDFER